MKYAKYFDKSPWPHQLDGFALAVDAVERGQDSCITAPTGGGKSLMMAAIIRWCVETGRNVILYTNRILLTEQTSRVLDEHGIDYGVIAATMPKHENRRAPVQLASVQTVHRRAMRDESEDLWPADVVLVDEVHNIAKGVNQDLLEAHRDNGAVLLGVTATPMGVSHLIPHLIVAGCVSHCRHVGALVPAVYKVSSELNTSKLTPKSDGEFAYADIKKIWTPKIIGHVYDHWRRFNPDARPSLGFAPGVAESIWFTDQFEKRGVPAAHIDGQDVYVDGQAYKKNRSVYEDVIQRWKGGDIKVLWNRFVMREGIDLPECYNLILACPIGSLKGYIQTVGRALRKSSETPHHVIISDHCGNYYRHGYSPNDDIPWHKFYWLPESMPTKIQKADLQDDSEKEPYVCPNCGTVARGRQCPPPPFGCGTRIPRRRRMVIQKNGELRTVHHPAVPRRVERMYDDTLKKWRDIWWRCKNSGRSTAQAEGFFFHVHRYWPPRNLPLMPKWRDHRWRRIDRMEPYELISEGEYLNSKRQHL